MKKKLLFRISLGVIIVGSMLLNISVLTVEKTSNLNLGILSKSFASSGEYGVDNICHTIYDSYTYWNECGYWTDRRQDCGFGESNYCEKGIVSIVWDKCKREHDEHSTVRTLHCSNI